jgi:hypothetical protein
MVPGEGRPIISRRYRFVSFYINATRWWPAFFESNKAFAHGGQAQTAIK